METKAEINFKGIGTSIGELVASKNRAYGDSFAHSGEILKLLFPNGVPVEQYTVVLALVRILDKIFRLATNPTYNSENCWHDIAGYCILMSGYEKQKEKKEDPNANNRPTVAEIPSKIREFDLDDIKADLGRLGYVFDRG